MELKTRIKPGVEAHSYNLSIQKPETGELRIHVWSSLYSETLFERSKQQSQRIVASFPPII